NLNTAGGPVRVAASSQITADAAARGGGTGSVVSFSEMQPTATLGGLTTAYLTGTVNVAGTSLDVTADALHTATARSLNISISFIAHAGTEATATVNRVTEA